MNKDNSIDSYDNVAIYKYTGLMKINKFLGKLMASLSCIVVLAILFVLPWKFSIMALQQFVFLLLFAILSIYMVGFYPDIEIDDEGIILEFFWWELEIPWNMVVEVKRVNSMMIFETWYVKVRKLTFFHKLYGLTFLGSVVPIFIIHKNLKKRTELIQEIKRYISKSRT